MEVLIIGGGLSGSTLARFLAENNVTVDVIEQRNNVGGNCSTVIKDNIIIHEHGAHIFHTNDKECWDFVNRFAEFETYNHIVKIDYGSGITSMPINLNTFNDLFGINTPNDARIYIENATKDYDEGTNFEEACLKKFGKVLYEMLIKPYSEKQWGKECKDIPKHIVDRIPLRYSFDDRYFTDKYQGMPKSGYTNMIESMLSHSKINLTCDKKVVLDDIKSATKQWNFVVYCGALDELMGYEFGNLDYRSLKFETDRYSFDTIQGCAVLNKVNSEYTRSIEHKHFNSRESEFTFITKEYPCSLVDGGVPYYPINDDLNNKLYDKYLSNVIGLLDYNFIPLGRLAEYKYYDMDKTISSALKVGNKILNSFK